jgi:myo-inositol catabolism protein IolS
MQQRSFGRTGLLVSERGFGAWAIGGSAYGAVSAEDALDALAKAEELGCNFVDTAAVYGESEALLGRFLPGRRDRWVLASKYSAQPEGLTTTLERQLTRLRTDRVDLYQIHWAPSAEQESLYAELERLKASGKIRYAGVSLRSVADVPRVLAHSVIDGIQIPVSLLDPSPLLPSLELLRQRRPGIIARSALRGGFLTGRYARATRFENAADQRGLWTRAEISRLARQVERFQFLAEKGRTLRDAALAYPLSFPEVSTVIVSCKSAQQADENFRSSPPLTDDSLRRIHKVQRALRLGRPSVASRLLGRLRALLQRHRS